MKALECRVNDDGFAKISVYNIQEPTEKNGKDGRFVLCKDGEALSSEQWRSISSAVHALEDPSGRTKAAVVNVLVSTNMDVQSAQQLVDGICETIERRRRM